MFKYRGLRRPLFLLLIVLCSPALFAQSGGSAASGAASGASTTATAVDTAYLWRQAVGGAVLGRPTVQAQSVVVVLDGGSVKAYSSSGRPLWDFSARGRLSPYVTRSREGTSYICRTNGIFIALNRIGRELWRINIGEALAGPVVLGWDGRVFIPASKKIFCYTASGNLLWTQALEHKISAGPWLDQGGGILLALENGEAMRINHFGEAAAWRLPSVPHMLLSVNSNPANNRSADFPILVLYSNGNMQLVKQFFPIVIVADLPRLPAPPLAAASRGGNAAAALNNGQLVMLSGADGAIQWTAETRVRLQDNAAVVYDDRGIYVLSVTGAAGFTANGDRLWFSNLTNASGLPAFDDEGVLYSGGKDWILYAWKLEEKALKQKRNLYGPAPEGAYRVGSPPSSFGMSAGRFEESVVKGELEIINRGIVEGRVGAYEREWINYLIDIAGNDFRQGPFSANRPRALITHRIMALQLLSRIGSSELIPWLVRFFRTEDEPLVKAAAARAIGGIGVDPNGLAISEFLAAALSTSPVPNEQVLVSVAAATGALCRFSGPPLFETGARILVILSGADQRSIVQKQARHELDTLGTMP